MNIFGDKDLFAICYEFIKDPDDGKCALVEESDSWGRLSIWIQGNNICQSSYKGEDCQYITWYLIHVMDWLASNWYPLLYEERPPALTKIDDARTFYYREYATQPFSLMSDSLRDEWYQWGQRHSFRSCSCGGLFPDLFIRGCGDSVEFSWDNLNSPGYPDGYAFSTKANCICIKRDVVVKVLSDFLNESCADLYRLHHDSKLVNKLRDTIDCNKSYDMKKHIKWMFPKSFLSKLDTLLVNSHSIVKKFISEMSEKFVPAPILMFGTMAPSINEDDIKTLMQYATPADIGHHVIDNFVKNSPISHQEPYISGYNLALDLIDNFSEIYNSDSTLENILDKFNVNYITDEFSDQDMRGIAISGHNIKPTIVINKNHRFNSSEPGIRFSIAHELCHLLYDRQYGREVGIISGPWAPAGIEKRANAFAAMLLMPETLLQKMLSSVDVVNVDTIKAMANELNVSKKALVEHLYNLRAINFVEKDQFLNDTSFLNT